MENCIAIVGMLDHRRYDLLLDYLSNSFFARYLKSNY